MDADLSHDPADLARLLAAVRDGGADVALGSRYVPGGGGGRLGSVAARSSAAAARGTRAVSSGCGSATSRAASSASAPRCCGRSTCPPCARGGYAFQVELTYRAVRAGFRVVEVPIVFRERAEGRSKMSWAIAAEAVWLVPRLRARARGRPRADPR